jgi:hypothetical protein
MRPSESNWAAEHPFARNILPAVLSCESTWSGMYLINFMNVAATSAMRCNVRILFESAVASTANSNVLLYLSRPC